MEGRRLRGRPRQPRPPRRRRRAGGARLPPVRRLGARRGAAPRPEGGDGAVAGAPAPRLRLRRRAGGARAGRRRARLRRPLPPPPRPARLGRGQRDRDRRRRPAAAVARGGSAGRAHPRARPRPSDHDGGRRHRHGRLPRARRLLPECGSARHQRLCRRGVRPAAAPARRRHRQAGGDRRARPARAVAGRTQALGRAGGAHQHREGALLHRGARLPRQASRRSAASSPSCGAPSRSRPPPGTACCSPTAAPPR